MLWFDTKNKIINRFEPQRSNKSREQNLIDKSIRDLLLSSFLNYVYIGNIQKQKICVRRIRRKLRHSTDNFCIEYSLLYVIRRIKRMSHEEAILDLINNVRNILDEITELLRRLVYKNELNSTK